MRPFDVCVSAEKNNKNLLNNSDFAINFRGDNKIRPQFSSGIDHRSWDSIDPGFVFKIFD